MPRFFTLSEAEELLPQVERWLRTAIDTKRKAVQLDTEMKQLLTRVTVLGGMQVNTNDFTAWKTAESEALRQLQQALKEIESAGCLVKDLDIGLVDFPTIFDGQEVYLCWKLGEARIGHWHGVTEGFQGRKLIDGDFLDRHQGGRTQ